jgi:hypothetical protein
MNTQKQLYLLVENGTAFGIIDYIPNAPYTVKYYEASEEDYHNFLHNDYKFNSKTEKLEPPSEEETITKLWQDVRNKRNSLLSYSDWTTLPDAPIDKELWYEYRQKLRDMPNNFSDPREVIFPEEPK